MEPQTGQLINNKYRLVRFIGDGGMGSVFEARHELLGTTVALKFLHAELLQRQGLVDRFLQEAQVCARIHSPHVARVSDVDRAPEGLAYMVMEYVEGTTLQHLYESLSRQGRRLTYCEAFQLIGQLLSGVGAAHSMGVVHRDLKPDNVMLTRDKGTGATLVKIVDFGIAKLRATGDEDRKLTQPGSVIGTPEYMAPEQAFAAGKVDARADIFSLGVMAFEMFAGRRPFGGENAMAIAAQYLEGNIPDLRTLVPSLPTLLAQAVHRAMAPRPEQRFESAQELRDALAPFAPVGPALSLADLMPSAAPGPIYANVSPASGPAASSALPEGSMPSRLPVLADPSTAAHLQLGPAALPATTSGGPASAQPAFSAGPGSYPSSGPVTSEPMALRPGSTPAPNTALQSPSALPEQPGATVLGDPFSPLGPGATDGLQAVPAGPYPGAPGSAGQPFALGAASQAVVPGGSIPLPAPRKRASSGPSLMAILLVGGGIAAAVVGGVYAVHELGSADDSADKPAKRKPQPTEPPAANRDPAPPQPVVAERTVEPATTPSTSSKPQPTQAQPAHQPTTQAASPVPTLVIPSSLPSVGPLRFPNPPGPKPSTSPKTTPKHK